MNMKFNTGMIYKGQFVEVWSHDTGYLAFIATQDGVQPLSQAVYRVRVNGELRVELGPTEGSIGPLNG